MHKGKGNRAPGINEIFLRLCKYLGFTALEWPPTREYDPCTYFCDILEERPKVNQENRRRFWDPCVKFKTVSKQMA